MIILGTLVLYLVIAILTARRLVYETMCINEKSTYLKVPLEAKLYSKSDYLRIARKVSDYRYVSADEVPISDYTGILLHAGAWPLLWTLRALHAMVMNGHKKTPGQREKELKEREREMKKLEAQCDREWKNKLKEAGIEE